MSRELLNNILRDMKVELSDEFDSNFQQGSFFGDKWKAKRDGSSSYLQGFGKLRKSIKASIKGNSVVFSSSENYAAIHNEGGEITVTKKMRKYFWAQYYKHGKTNAKAKGYKAMALKPIGSKIVIPQRQFIGHHTKIDKAVKEIIEENLNEYVNQNIKFKDNERDL